jgi:hypothetical protein
MMGYHTPWNVLSSIEPDPRYYEHMPSDWECNDMGTGWCTEAQDWKQYARVDTQPYWGNDYYASVSTTPMYGGSYWVDDYHAPVSTNSMYESSYWATSSSAMYYDESYYRIFDY